MSSVVSTRQHTRRRFVAVGAAGFAGLLAGGASEALADAVSGTDAQLGADAQLAGIRAINFNGSVKTSLGDEWLPLDGFPTGWSPQIGDRVVVTAVTTDGRRAARPLVHSRRVVASPRELDPPATVAGIKITDTTILMDNLPDRQRLADDLPVAMTVWIVDREPGAAESARAVAVRPE